MSSGRLALVLTLGIATYLASQEPERRTPRARARSTPASPTAEAAGAADVATRAAEVAARAVDAATAQPIALGVPFTLNVPSPYGAVVTPSLAQVKPLQPVSPATTPPLEMPPPRALAPAAPALTPAQEQVLTSLGTNVSELTRKLTDLTTEVERLNQWRSVSEGANRRAARPMRSVPTESGRLETAAGAPAVPRPRRQRQPKAEEPPELRTDPGTSRSLVDEPGDILGLGRVTDNLMKRMERLED